MEKNGGDLRRWRCRKLKWVFQPGDEVRSSLALSRILEADGAQVVILVPAHPRLFGHGKCMTPKVRSLDGAACVLLCVELKPCRLHVVLLRRANCWICKRDVNALMKVVSNI